LAHADVSIKNLEAWICGRLTAATVDGHRRRRGQLGALQRPRVPKWLSEALGQDRWFVDLAVQILNWVGVSTTAGSQLWPLDAWTLRRSTLTGDVTGSSPAQVGRDVDTVLAAMRRRPDWYAAYIERPLGHKQAPVALSDPATDQEPLMLGEPADADDASLLGLATEALAAISKRLRDQEDPSAAITEVIHSLFGAADALPGIDQPPHRAIDYQPRLAALLHDPERIARIVPAILSIVAEVRVTDLPEATGPGQVGQ
jgi:hypothetical protein